MQKKRSAVWRHFAEEGENKVSCRMCNKRLTKHGNTSMMLRHLRGKHPELMHCLLIDAEGPSGQEEGWQVEEPQVEEVVEALPPMDASVKKKRSTVWKHFQEEGTDKVSCSICNEKLAKHGNTSSMLRHLRGKHPQLKLGDLQGDNNKKMNRLHLRSGNTETRFLSVCERLLLNNQLTDCTLVAEGQFVQAHRLVLATCSEIFEEMFKTVCQANPVVVLRDVSLQELRGLISYMYKGETLVKSHDLPGLLKAATQLKIKGLSHVSLSDTFMDDSRSGVPTAATAAASSPPPHHHHHHHHHHHVTPKQDMTLYQEDQEMEGMDEDDPDAQGQQKKTSGATINLMAMCEEVVLDEGGAIVTEDGGRTLKRVQIKLEHGVGMGGEELQAAVEMPAHQSPDAFLATPQEEVVIHHEAEDLQHQQQQLQQQQQQQFQQQQQQQQQQERGMGMRGEDPLTCAVKITNGASATDLAEQNLSGILTASGTVVRVGSATPQQQGATAAASSVQSAIDNEGLILLGLAGGGEGQGKVYPGPSQTSLETPTRPPPLRRLRKYSKQDLLTALNLIRDGHLGIKPAARAFNIPVATLYNATKRHDISSPMQQGANKDIWQNKASLLVSTDGIHYQCLPARSPTLPEAS